VLILVANSCRPPPEAIRRDHMAHGAYAWLAVREALCWQGGSLEEGCAVSAGRPSGPHCPLSDARASSSGHSSGCKISCGIRCSGRRHHGPCCGRTMCVWARPLAAGQGYEPCSHRAASPLHDGLLLPQVRPPSATAHSASKKWRGERRKSPRAPIRSIASAARRGLGA